MPDHGRCLRVQWTDTADTKKQMRHMGPPVSHCHTRSCCESGLKCVAWFARIFRRRGIWREPPGAASVDTGSIGV